MTTSDAGKRREYIVLIEHLNLIECEVAEIDAVSHLSEESFSEDWDSDEDAAYDQL